MQNERLKLTQLQKIESRIKSTKTPDKILNRTVSSVASPRKKPGTSKPTSVFNSTINSVNLRKLEAENYNLDMELAYSDYVGSFAELIVENEALEDTEKSLTKSIKSICEETKALREKCKLIETRVRDVKAASALINYQDKIVDYERSIKNELNKYDVESILSQLKLLLNKFNVLRCENIILPANKEEVQEFKEIFIDCCNELEKIGNPIQSENLGNLSENYKKFTTLVQEITSLKKIIEVDLLNLQMKTLKTCSSMFAEDNIWNN